MVPDQWFFWMSLFFGGGGGFLSSYPTGYPIKQRNLHSKYANRMGWLTPLNTNMEHKNHPLEKENHLNQTSILRVSITPPKQKLHISP